MKINKSASRVVDVLELISENENPMSITEISHLLNIPKSSTFELLYTLVEKGFLEIADEKLRTFKLGLKLFTVGSAFLRKANLTETARPFLELMMQQAQDTAFLAVENKGNVIYLDKIEANTTGIRPTATLGSTNPMTCTGLGKALLATYPIENVIKLIGRGQLIIKTKYSIKTYEELLKELDETKKRGYAIDDRESQEEIFCVAAPIYDYSNKAIAAISIASLAYKMNEKRQEELGKTVVKTALDISARLGFTGNDLFYKN